MVPVSNVTKVITLTEFPSQRFSYKYRFRILDSQHGMLVNRNLSFHDDDAKQL